MDLSRVFLIHGGINNRNTIKRKTERTCFCPICYFMMINIRNDNVKRKKRKQCLTSLTSAVILYNSTLASWGYSQQRSGITPLAGTRRRQACWQIWPAARLSPFCKRTQRQDQAGAGVKKKCVTSVGSRRRGIFKRLK